jgi:hypothetical protein
MMIAERASARIAVGALALAALAVSARPTPARVAPAVIERDASFAMTGYARLGAIAVVGTPSYERAVAAIAPLERQLDRCAAETTRVTIYAHVTHQHITELAVLGDSEDAALCVQQIVGLVGLPIDDDVDVMIPVDLVTP